MAMDIATDGVVAFDVDPLVDPLESYRATDDVITFDTDSLLESYQATDTSFELPSSADTPLPTSTYKSVPYSLIEASPAARTVKVIHKDVGGFLSDAGIRGMVTGVSHGTFESRPASLIVFSFILKSGQRGFRFENANIKITFSKHPRAPATDATPEVVKFAPRKMYGLETKEGRKDMIGGEVSLEVPAGPVTPGINIKNEHEATWEQSHRYKTIGNTWSSRPDVGWDIVFWDMRQNKRTKEGIPDRLNAAVVVDRPGPFVASVEVTVDTPFANGLFSNPFSKQRPVAFSPGVEIGTQPRTKAFDQLSEAEWKRMIPYEEEWENKFLEAAARLYQAPGAWPIDEPTPRHSNESYVRSEEQVNASEANTAIQKDLTSSEGSILY